MPKKAYTSRSQSCNLTDVNKSGPQMSAPCVLIIFQDCQVLAAMHLNGDMGSRMCMNTFLNNFNVWGISLDPVPYLASYMGSRGVMPHGVFANSEI